MGGASVTREASEGGLGRFPGRLRSERGEAGQAPEARGAALPQGVWTLAAKAHWPRCTAVSSPVQSPCAVLLLGTNTAAEIPAKAISVLTGASQSLPSVIRLAGLTHTATIPFPFPLPGSHTQHLPTASLQPCSPAPARRPLDPNSCPCSPSLSFPASTPLVWIHCPLSSSTFHLQRRSSRLSCFSGFLSTDHPHLHNKGQDTITKWGGGEG